MLPLSTAPSPKIVRASWKASGRSGLTDEDGLIIGTIAGEIPLWESEVLRYTRKEIDAEKFSRSIRHQSLAAVGESRSALLGFRGKFLLVASACSAATKALGALWVQQSKVKRCLVGGVEVLSNFTIEGFRSLQILSPKLATPFDRSRQGINLSEGAGFFCLENRSKNALAQLSGFGLSTDAYHMASPHPEGRGSLQAMEQALDTAELSPGEIDWVHSHGTGSQANDQAEGAAIYQLFGEDLSKNPWVSSTKHIHGHALGASGALEVALCIEALRHQTILKTAGLTHPDPAILVRHPPDHLRVRVRHILKKTLGFGGNNAALVISEFPEGRRQGGVR